jgi:hypothetical protein
MQGGAQRIDAQPDPQRLPDALRQRRHMGGFRRCERLAGGLAPQRQPALEVRLIEVERPMRGHRIAAIGTAAQQHRRPERDQGVQVRRPVLHRGLEHRPEERVAAGASVEGVHQARDRLVVGEMRCVGHRGRRSGGCGHADIVDDRYRPALIQVSGAVPTGPARRMPYNRPAAGAVSSVGRASDF